jgi:hypothetical protein
MSIFGTTKAERLGVIQGTLQICLDCGYDGQDCHPDMDVCGECGHHTHAGDDDACEHCGATGCLMQACPQCGAQLEINYERMNPVWDAKHGFRRFERAVARVESNRERGE